MKAEKIKLLNDLNRSIIKFRNMYSVWAEAQGISYHEMLVYYTIREYGFCTQKLICDSYILPKQTINNVFKNLCNEGVLVPDAEQSVNRQKAFGLSEMGKQKYLKFIDTLNAVEDKAFELMGEEKLRQLNDVFVQYDNALSIVFGGGNGENS